MKIEKLNKISGVFYLAESYLLGVVFGVEKFSSLFNIYVLSLLVLFLIMGIIKIPNYFKVKKVKYWDLTANYIYIVPGLLGFFQLSHYLPSIEILVAILCWLSGMSLFSKESKTADFLGEKRLLLLSALFFLMTANVILMNDYLGSVGFLTIVYPGIPLLVYYHKLGLSRAQELLRIVSALLFLLLILIGLPSH